MDYIKVIEFGPEHLKSVADFDCGPEPYAQEQAEWIRNAPPFHGALWAKQKFKTTVWLHLNCLPEHEPFVFGYTSLGHSNMPDPYPDGERRRVQYIPGIGLSAQYHGQRTGDKKYSHILMEHLITSASARDQGILGLHVYPENVKAIRLYEYFGFKVVGGPDKNNLLAMWRKLNIGAGFD